MPIFENVFSNPLSIDLQKFLTAFSASDLGRKQAALNHILQSFNRQIGIHRAGPIADQQRKVHHLAGLAALDNQRNLGARPFLHQMVVHRRQCQQRRDRRVFLVHAAVGENQQRVSVATASEARRHQAVESALQSHFRPRPRGSNADNVVASSSPLETRRSFSRSRLVRTGCGSLSV